MAQFVVKVISYYPLQHSHNDKPTRKEVILQTSMYLADKVHIHKTDEHHDFVMVQANGSIDNVVLPRPRLGHLSMIEKHENVEVIIENANGKTLERYIRSYGLPTKEDLERNPDLASQPPLEV